MSYAFNMLSRLLFVKNDLFHSPAIQNFSRTSVRRFSVLKRPPPNYEGHVPLTGLEKGILAAGSALLAFFNPRRGGMFARS